MASVVNAQAFDDIFTTTDRSVMHHRDSVFDDLLEPSQAAGAQPGIFAQQLSGGKLLHSSLLKLSTKVFYFLS